MIAILTSAGLLFFTGLFGLLLPPRPNGGRLALAGVLAGGIVGIAGTVATLAQRTLTTWQLPLQPLPCGKLIFQLDWCSGIFLVILLVLAMLSAVSGWGLRRLTKQGTGSFWFFYNSLIASMVLILSAGDVVIFLFGWEIMAITSFFLVIWEAGQDGDQTVKTGWTYLVASHLSFFPVLGFFLLLSAKAGGSMAFSDLARVRLDSGEAAVLFVLALLGFGTKAGFPGVHVWLPGAHAAAPGMVSAVMSGAMTKMGLYGLIRALGLLGAPATWWGWTLVGIGAVGGLYGVIMALGQSHLKRILAYSTVENIGIICLGLGLGITALGHHEYGIAAVALTGAMFHAVNHALFKGLLFQSVFAIVTMTKEHSIETLGGLQQRMPITGICTLGGSAAIAGLPPFNGFISEFLIYYAAFQSIMGNGDLQLIGLTTIAVLALIGGLALVCFGRLYGAICCGEPKTVAAATAQEAPIIAALAPATGLALCVLATVGSPWLAGLCWQTIRSGLRIPLRDETLLTPVMGPLTAIVLIALALTVLTAGVLLLRHQLLRRRIVTQQETWGCGYPQIDAHMQYSAGSLVQPTTEFFRPVLDLQDRREFTTTPGSWRQTVNDVFLRRVWEPLFALIYHGCLKLRPFQDGRVQVYLLYLVIMVIALLFWTLY